MDLENGAVASVTLQGADTDNTAFLIQALDGDPQGISPPPPLPPLPTACGPEIVAEAVAFLRRSSLPVKPRRQWPPGKSIDPEHRPQPGRVLCVWNDAGWGRLVSQGKQQEGRFSNELVGACATLLREWRPDPSPTWVAAIPSLRHPHLVPDFRTPPRRCAGPAVQRRAEEEGCPAATENDGEQRPPSPQRRRFAGRHPRRPAAWVRAAG